MKLKITTTYEYVDHNWLKWWIYKCGPNYMISGVADRPVFPFEFSSKDPSSAVTATRVELEEDDD